MFLFLLSDLWTIKGSILFSRLAIENLLGNSNLLKVESAQAPPSGYKGTAGSSTCL